MKDKNLDFLINNLIILCKHFIDRCKFLKVKPHFSGWKNEQDICEVSSLHAAQKHKETLKCFELVFVVRIIRPFFFLFYSALSVRCCVRSPLRDIVVGKIRGEWKKIQGGRKKYFSNVLRSLAKLLRSLAKIFAFPRKT